MAKLYKVDGTVEEIKPKNGKDFKLQELYDLIGTDIIECVYFDRSGKELMIVDEAGWCRERPIENEEASKIARVPIAGNAVVCLSKQFK